MTNPYDPPAASSTPDENASYRSAVINGLVVLAVAAILGVIGAFYYYVVFDKPLSTNDAVVYLHGMSNYGGHVEVEGNIVGDTEEKTFEVEDKLVPEHIDRLAGCSSVTIKNRLFATDVIVEIVPLPELDASRQCTVPMSHPRD